MAALACRARLQTLLVELSCRLWVRLRIAKIWVAGFEDLSSNEPQILIANHTCILDTPLLVSLMSLRGIDWHVWAAERIVGRYGRMLGSRYIRVGTQFGAIMKLIDESHSVLTRDATILVYPEGEHRQSSSPITCAEGALRLARAFPTARMHAVGIAYEVFRVDRPIVAVTARPVRVLPTNAQGMAVVLEDARAAAQALLVARGSELEKMV